MARTNVVLQMTIEETLKDLMVQTGADNVIVDSEKNETLATRLAALAADIKNVSDNAITSASVKEQISAAIDELIAGAPGTYDTLKEIADYIASDKTAMEALNSAITGKVDKVEGKELTSNDFTDALLQKLNGIATGATKVEASNTNGNIKINGQEKTVYTHPVGNGNNHLPVDGVVGKVLRATGSGAGTWGDNVRSGASAPPDLAPGELFIKLV